MSKKVKLVKALKKGEKLTAGQIRQRFRIANPSAAVSDLRLNDGYRIVSVEVPTSRGVTRKYSYV